MVEKPRTAEIVNLTQPTNGTNHLLANLQDYIKSLGSALVAFSGGVDSALIAKIAADQLGNNALAVTANSPSMPPGELQEARRVASQIGIRHRVVQTNELENPNYQKNTPNRCYYCKKELMRALQQVQRKESLAFVLDGTNADDLRGHRPGFGGVWGFGCLSPLVVLGVGKGGVRLLAGVLGLSVAERVSGACLSSRVVFGEVISLGGLGMVGLGEVLVRGVVGVGLVRVRKHGLLGRVEVGGGERGCFFDVGVLDRVVGGLRGLGFGYVTLDLEGYRPSGESAGLASGPLVSEGLLRRVGEAEGLVRMVAGVGWVMVHVHGALARIEVARGERCRFFDVGVLDEIARRLRGLGFGWVALDMEGSSSQHSGANLTPERLNTN